MFSMGQPQWIFIDFVHNRRQMAYFLPLEDG